MASKEAEDLKAAFIAMRENASSAGETSIEAQRESVEMLGLLASQPEGVTYTEVDAGGVPAIWVDPANGRTDRCIQYVHGGGYVIGTANAYRRFTGHLANVTGCRVLNVDYRLAPEHPHPAAVTDSTAAYRWLLSQGFEGSDLAIAGDSAGGGLTVATLVALRDAGDPQPACAAPISPWVDMECKGASMSLNAQADVLIGESGIKSMADLFLNGQAATDPLAAPLHADLSGLAPLYVQVGADETLLDDSTRLVDQVQAAGGEAAIEIFPEMQHVFQLSCGTMPEATEATDKIGAFLRQHLRIDQ